ncbi:MAG: YbaB/EbfC family nucleoid-associated protein [Deltaproteobacteria bacterium CG11_big_fil_rev_8_21_14_0_20_42_23]|nr:MAG: YbaB/EbfC family nucleoid-associated protein [Deltaproteobacteria bacterium CG11_big_fil_rev_8_21_14_0_20_42_23]PJC64803.1 MAG: YbaB/EbfC family nucleoid-associated protein [Deltaproteobacteria bacterium CG_4_9_14_0_2_um_filter_42_21]
MGLFEMKDMVMKARKMQKDMKRQQKELAKQNFEGVAGDGLVRIIMNGKNEVKEVKLDASVVNANDVRRLEDLIRFAVNDAGHKASEAAKESMSGMMSGMDMGAMSKMLGM